MTRPESFAFIACAFLLALGIINWLYMTGGAS